MSSNRQIKRGTTQSLYKYLPASWIDFPLRGKERRQYVAKVERWNSEKIVNINSERLIRTVNHAIQSYAAQAKNPTEPAISGFGTELTTNNCDVLTPKVSDVERGIVAKINPLTFYCKKCRKVYQFNSEEAYRKMQKCNKCGIELTQFRYIYFCKCGFATDKHPVRCREHGNREIYWNGAYDFSCHVCNKKIAMQVKCPICGSHLGPKTALDPSQFFTYSLNLIDLIDSKLEDFISKEHYGKDATIAFWLEKISREDLDNIIQNGITTNQDDYKLKLEENFEMFMKVFNDEVQAKIAAQAMTDKDCGNTYATIIKEIKTKLYATIDNINKLAEMILEYSMVKELANHATIDTAIKVAKTLNTNANPEIFKDVAKRYGISNVQACDEIPFISCSYGYTRAKAEYEDGVKLNAFREETNGRKNIYAVRMNTEGVLFEFDRKKIIEWMARNSFITLEDDINSFSDEEAKLWFINHIKPDEIRSFTAISEEEAKETYYVYRLLHSISHLLIRGAADIGGLGKDSLAEYIFPGIPAVLIYCQNSQGFDLGSLFNTFEAYFDKWMNRAYAFAQKCIFDPICIERNKACTGCLFLNEISCQHFNKDLDRALIIGHVDKETKKRIIGFWEE